MSTATVAVGVDAGGEAGAVSAMAAGRKQRRQNCRNRIVGSGVDAPPSAAILLVRKLGMPDLDLIKQEEQEDARDECGQFRRGHSGNPAGRPKGCRNRVDRAVRALPAEEGEALE